MSTSTFELIEAIISAAVIVINVFSIREESGQPKPTPGVLLAPGKKKQNGFVLLVVRIILVVVFSFIIFQINGVYDKFVFVIFYFIVPLVFSKDMFASSIDDFDLGFFLITKGVYYAFLAIISMLQCIFVENADFGKLALGFTMSLAVLETITSVSDGKNRIRGRRLEKIMTHHNVKDEPPVEAAKKEEACGNGSAEGEVRRGSTSDKEIVEGEAREMET